MKRCVLIGAALAAITMIIAAGKDSVFLVLISMSISAACMMLYFDICERLEKKAADRRRREHQLRAKNRKDIYRIQEIQVKEQLLRDYDKIKL